MKQVELSSGYVHHFLSLSPNSIPTLNNTLSIIITMTNGFSIFLAALLVSTARAFAPVGNMASTTIFRLSTFQSSSSALEMSNGGVVITGSAGGVGFAYAGEFMDRGYDVVICDVKDCSVAAEALKERHPNGKVFHTRCDVSDARSVDDLAAFARKNLGTVKYWINNAGVNGGRRDLRDVPISQVEMVVKVNLLGTLLCTKAAMEIMGEQVGTKDIV
jgi:hypothetical protein